MVIYRDRLLILASEVRDEIALQKVYKAYPPTYQRIKRLVSQSIPKSLWGTLALITLPSYILNVRNTFDHRKDILTVCLNFERRWLHFSYLHSTVIFTVQWFAFQTHFMPFMSVCFSENKKMYDNFCFFLSLPFGFQGYMLIFVLVSVFSLWFWVMGMGIFTEKLVGDSPL